MSGGSLRVENLGKAYRRYESEWQRVFSWFGLPVKPSEEHWVLRHINFTIQPGEAVGIVGQNGAGKSTLLKLITDTLRPSEGRVHIAGRVSAILELGMGFNVEFSGRQNAQFTAGLMGYSQSDINHVMPEIEAFAEIGEYFDQPMRTYSSGMQMRVAFSVATAFRPDLLIVDEALSVGDSYFQHKSFDRIREFQDKGSSLLIVSHDRSAVQALCGRAILLEQGRMIKDGKPEEVMDFYNALIAEKENQKVELVQHTSGKVQTISGTGEAALESIQLLNSKKQPIEVVGVGESVELVVRVRLNADIPKLVFGYMIKDRLGQTVFGTNTWHTKQVLLGGNTGSVIEYCVAFEMNLGPGSYSIAVALHADITHVTCNYEWRDLACVFHVSNFNKNDFIGSTWMTPIIEVHQ